MTEANNQKEVDELEKKSRSFLSKINQLTLGKWDTGVVKAIQNDITNIDVLNKCDELKDLRLKGVQITTINKCKIIQKIVALCITGCNNIINFKFLKKCCQVEDFSIIDMQITNLSMILYLKTLKKLQINHNYYITDFSALSQCIGLSSLSISNTSISDISPILNLKNLEELWIKQNKNLPSEFQQLNPFKSKEIPQLFDKWKQFPRNNDHLYNQNNKLVVQIQDQSIQIKQITIDNIKQKKRIQEIENNKHLKQDKHESRESKVQNIVQIQQDLHNQILQNQQQNTIKIENIQKQRQDECTQLETHLNEQNQYQAQRLSSIQEQNQQQMTQLLTFMEQQNQFQTQTLQIINQGTAEQFRNSVKTLQKDIANQQNDDNKSISYLLYVMQSDE